MTLSKLLELSYKHSLLYKSSVENSIQLVKLGSTGAFLQENLLNEWFNSIVIRPDCSVFYNKSSFKETYNYAKNLCSHYVPFGVAEMIDNNSKSRLKEEPQEENVVHNVKIIDNGITLRCTMFVPPSEDVQYFHQWQRQRKMWWRKFSPMPGRYSLTDIQSSGTKQEVKVVTQQLWGKIDLETVTLYSNIEHPMLAKEDLEAKFGRKKVVTSYIISDIQQSTMVLNTIYDAFEETTFHDKKRLMFRFHRKMAPYKISFVVVQSTKEVTDELNQLAQYLCRQIRANAISSLLLPSSSKLTLDVQFQHYDELGVPYTVLLNETTLRNGIVSLRSRDTTLKEQIHITDLPNYAVHLFRNF